MDGLIPEPNRNETHTHSMNISKHLIDRNIFRGNPANPRKEAEWFKEIPGEKVPGGGSKERIQEELFMTEPPSISLSVKRIEKSACHKIGRPKLSNRRTTE